MPSSTLPVQKASKGPRGLLFCIGCLDLCFIRATSEAAVGNKCPAWEPYRIKGSFPPPTESWQERAYILFYWGLGLDWAAMGGLPALGVTDLQVPRLEQLPQCGQSALLGRGQRSKPTPTPQP